MHRVAIALILSIAAVACASEPAPNEPTAGSSSRLQMSFADCYKDPDLTPKDCAALTSPTPGALTLEERGSRCMQDCNWTGDLSYCTNYGGCEDPRVEACRQDCNSTGNASDCANVAGCPDPSKEGLGLDLPPEAPVPE